MGGERSEDTFSLPNLLTASRIAAAPLLAFAVLAGQPPELAAGIALAAAASDLLDGAVARLQGKTSEFGAVLDPIADKVFILTALVLLIAAGTLRGAAVWAALIVLWRETLVTGLRGCARSQGQAAPVSLIAKLKTAAQFLAVVALFGARIPWPVSDVLFAAGAGLLWTAAGLALYSGADYLWRARRRSWK
jgi:CDP-diacylglycerol--glycerol-3-phosphate 3-phosphatidyltransferase